MYITDECILLTKTCYIKFRILEMLTKTSKGCKTEALKTDAEYHTENH